MTEASAALDRYLKHVGGAAYRRAHRPDWAIAFISAGCRELSGYAPAEFIEGRITWAEVMHPEDRGRVWTATQSLTPGAAAYEVEYRIVMPNGEERWVSDRGEIVAGTAESEPCCTGVVTDMSRRKRDESALADARAFSDAVLETAAEAVITIDTDGLIDTFNRAAQSIFGYTLEDVSGRDVSMLMPEPDRSNHHRYIDRYLQTNDPQIIGTGREVLARRKDGTVFPIFLAISEVAVGNERKFVGLIRDISVQRAAERAAREHLEQLAHVDRLNVLGEMASGIAHEINSPLTAISLFSQAAKRLLDAGNTARLPEIFDKLSLHAERAGAIIERMQTMARRGESARTPVAPNDLVREVAMLAEVDARTREITVAVDLAAGLPVVEVDAVQIQQVVLNLLRNGMEAMKAVHCAHGNTITLSTALEADGHVVVSVADTGTGVADAVAERLFTPFSSTKETGMGMGLSLSRTIITAHGGRLAYRNNDEHGATFFFTLPAAGEA